MAFRNISKLPAIFAWPSVLLSAPLQQRDVNDTTMTTYFLMSICNIWKNIFKNIMLRWAATAQNSKPCLPKPTSYIAWQEGRVMLIQEKSRNVRSTAQYCDGVQLARDVATDCAGTVSRHEARHGRSQDTCHQQRLSGLGVWFSLWVREVPGSNPSWAHTFL